MQTYLVTVRQHKVSDEFYHVRVNAENREEAQRTAISALKSGQLEDPSFASAEVIEPEAIECLSEADLEAQARKKATIQAQIDSLKQELDSI
ncbi:MAG TPA: hypothetical protein VM577_03910 [Anaerovoracaceae bacterium]|nr:hypothetical protein [Anaerovoracaceae bacterium]